jgi:hypothetical protein
MNLLASPRADAWGVVTIAEWGGYLVQVMPMLFNDRLVLTPETAPLGYDYGWCYPKGGAAHLAAAAWDPQNEGEPVGYIKAVTRGRPPGETAYECAMRDAAILRGILAADPGID